jgi:tripartite-type tricarboxylate transporter receptor subunit TctC
MIRRHIGAPAMPNRTAQHLVAVGDTMHCTPLLRLRLSRRLLTLAILAAAAIAPGGAAQAQPAWPAKPVTIVVPFPAGGGTDAFARPLFAAMTKGAGKQFIIDNKGGAGGTLGAGVAAHAAPDGYTFFMGAVHHAIAPAMYPKLDYNLDTDFVPVGLISSVPQVVVVNPQRVPVKDLKGLVDFLKKNPGKLNFGSAGNGTSHHLAGELFKLQTQTFITHIPYRGSGPALQDLIAGQVDLMFDGLGSSANHIKGGRIKALAVAGAQRAPGFADVPTAAEAGYPGYQVATWYGLWAPKGTPQAAVDGMAAEMKKALASDELKTIWAGLGANPPNLWGADFNRFVQGETRRWAEVVKKSGAKLD